MDRQAHSGVMAAIEKGMGAVLLGIVEGSPLLQVRLGQRQLSEIE